MLTAAEKAEREALATLSAIKTYVMQKFFTTQGLSHGLRLKIEKVESDVKILLEKGYLERMHMSSKLFITYKGWKLDK